MNQDPPEKPARRAARFGACKVRKKPLVDDSMDVTLIKRGDAGSDIILKSGDIRLLDDHNPVRNFWIQEDVADFIAELTRRVPPHGTVLLEIRTK